MATYNAPGTYVEDVVNGTQSEATSANTVGCLIGATRNGPLNTPTLVTSFNDFCDKFASGLKTPYLVNSYLTYAVSGFFANGGEQLYIDRVAHSTATKASGTISHINSGDNPATSGWFVYDSEAKTYTPTTDTQVVTGTTYYDVEATSHTMTGEENPSELNYYELDSDTRVYTLTTDSTCSEGDTYYSITATAQTPSGSTTVTDVTITAKNEGAWGNNLKITIAKSADWSESDLSYDITVENEGDSITITDLYFDTWVNALLNNLKTQYWIDSISVEEGYTALTETTVTFSGGVDGVTDLSDTDFINAIEDFGKLTEDIMFIAIPGQTSTTVNEALMAFGDKYKMFPLLDMPKGSSVADTRAYRKSIETANGGALNYPWLVVNDPLTEGILTVPTCGHVMGIYARMIETRGMQKAPAGESATVRGAISLERELSEDEIGILNPIGVVCICIKRNAGVVVWGARSLNSSDATLKYVTDLVINYTINKALSAKTRFAVFEPNNDSLWSRLKGVCVDYLEGLRSEGVLQGTSGEAYYVICDSSNNTQASIDAGVCNIDVGYAPSKPAEFVVIRLAHAMQS